MEKTELREKRENSEIMRDEVRIHLMINESLQILLIIYRQSLQKLNNRIIVIVTDCYNRNNIICISVGAKYKSSSPYHIPDWKIKFVDHQHASTEPEFVGETCSCLFFAQSFPFRAANETKNLFAEPLLLDFVATDGNPVLHTWSAGSLCLRQTLVLQLLQTVALENVKYCLHPFMGHCGFFFFDGSHSFELACFCFIAISSSQDKPVVSIDFEHISHTITFLLLSSGIGHSCDLYVLCSRQKTCR